MKEYYTIRIVEPVDKEIYSYLWESDEPAAKRKCYARLEATNEVAIDKIIAHASLTVTNKQPNEVEGELLTTSIGDPAFIGNTSTTLRLLGQNTPASNNYEALVRIIDTIIQQFTELFITNEPEEVEAIKDALLRAKEKLLEEVEY